MPFNPSKLEAYAIQHHVPILHPDSVKALQDYIREHPLHSVLEVGTAIGYSAMQMASVSPSIHVTSLERDANRFEEANQFIREAGMTSQIDVVLTDAADYQPTRSFDLLFIDAGKAQYQVFFERFAPYLTPGGVVICDNYYLHGLTVENAPKHKKTMARKLAAFKEFLASHPTFTTTILDVGDGLSVSVAHDSSHD
jgi:predicted O-methyltransferase YrrM